MLQSSNSKCNEGAADGVADGDGLKLGKSVFDIVELSSLSALSDGVTDGDGLGKSVFNIGSSTCSKELELSSLSALFDDFDFPFFCDFDALDFLCKRRRDSLIFVVASSEVSAWTISCLTIVCFNDSESSYRPSFASDTEIHLK